MSKIKAATSMRISEQLDDYIRTRANIEGVGYGLSPAFFEQNLRMMPEPCRIFGVLVEGGEMLGDDQEPSPGFFEAWQKSLQKSQ